MRKRIQRLFLITIVGFLSVRAEATLVTGPWTTPTGQGDGPITYGTGTVTVGNGTSNSADGEMFSSPFSPITLAFNGDKIIFTGTMQMIGSVNSAVTSGTPRTQFRLGLFNGVNTGADLGWLGYFMTNTHGTGTPMVR